MIHGAIQLDRRHFGGQLVSFSTGSEFVSKLVLESIEWVNRGWTKI